MLKKTLVAVITATVTGVVVVGLLVVMFFRPGNCLSKRPTWTVVLDKNKSKAADEYDVIVVGAGLGGLTSAALLTQEGYKTLVLEQAPRVGGYASRIDFDGYAAFYGAEDIAGVEYGSVGYLVRRLGYDPKDLFVPAARRFIFDGQTIDIPAGPGQFEDVLVKIFPADEQALHAFFNDASKAFQEIYEPSIIHTYGIPLSKEELYKLLTLGQLMLYGRTHRHLRDWLSTTFQEKLDEHFANKRIQNMLCSLLGYIGASRTSPALFVLVGTLTYFINGSHYLRGGPQALADLMSRYIVEHGGAVLCNTRAEKIITTHNQVAGVRAGNQTFKTSIVVSNVNAKTLYTELIDTQALPEIFLSTIKNIKMGRSSVMINLGIDKDLSNMPTFFADLDRHVHLIVRTSSDATLAPQGCSSVTILHRSEYGECPTPESPSYEPYVQKIFNEALARAELIIPDVRKHIVAHNVVTPYTFERTFLMPEGAIYGFDARTAKPFLQKSPLKGLYLASASAHICGVEAVVMAGIWVRNDIVGWDTLSASGVSRHNL